MVGNPFELINGSRRVNSGVWIAHFLVNQGSLAFTGALSVDSVHEAVYIDVSNIQEDLLKKVNTVLDGLCVCVLKNEKWLFKLANLSISHCDGAQILKCDMPTQAEPLPSRQCNRLDIKLGTAKIQLGEETYNLVNMSEGGCSFSCDNSIAKKWPPGQQMACTIIYGKNLLLESNISVVRIQHDISMPTSLNTLVSCQFCDGGTSALIEAALTHLSSESAP